jgi:SAM-dependent methyltransferase
MVNSIEERVAEQYSRGSLEQIILNALRAAGKDVDRLTPADLVAIDEFHIGGRQATVEFGGQMSLVRGSNVLDVGCGIGGPSRYFAKESGCQVTGIDLTDEYVRVAEMLTRRLGMDGAVSYRQASALKMPFEAGSFDGAYMIHVGMNIADKAALFAEVRRVLKPGAVFGIHDVMREGEGEIRFPMPWASNADTSFVETASGYRQPLEAAGFEGSERAQPPGVWHRVSACGAGASGSGQQRNSGTRPESFDGSDDPAENLESDRRLGARGHRAGRDGVRREVTWPRAFCHADGFTSLSRRSTSGRDGCRLR